jgi:predicted dehydrogenase/aryl-alcohol dehydrogenase-like predicted oxidoreductase
VERQLRWGIIGPGAIAKAFAAGLGESRTGRLVAVASRERAAAERFGDEFGAERRHEGYDALLADEGVDAVYVATPHPFHAEWAIRAAEAGKHVLCEKPLGINHAEAMAVVEAARRHDVFLLEGYMYRAHPQVARLVELIRSGAIGRVQAIEATFAFRTARPPEHRLLNHALAGGGILDIGGYCTSMARLVAGAAVGLPVAEPTAVQGVAEIGAESRVDEWAIASLKFPGGIVAQLLTGVRLAADGVVRVIGEEGRITLPAPWSLGSDGRRVRIVVERRGEAPDEIEATAERSPYALEADAVADHLAARQAPPPLMGWDDSLGNMRTLDRWREAVGLLYDAERPEARRPPVSGRPLAVSPGAPIPHAEIAGIGKPVSRLVLGVDNQRTMPHAAVMFDDFFERGGTAYDTAHVYGGGACERLLGHWAESRGVRDQVVILDKGAHTPFNTPDFVLTQLATSLERLRTDYVDLYMPHRDNPAVPVGEFVDVLDELVRTGRVRAYGLSNWSLPRVEEALAWAAAHDRAAPAAISNNFSLARMVNPVWPGCVAASDPDFRTWLERTQLPLMPWSSQARGFFTERGDPADRSDPELVRSWHGDDNFLRRERAISLAAKRGVAPIVVALAWVLRQPFPTFPLIGPRTLAETRTSLPALQLALTPEEVAWLNLEGEPDGPPRPPDSPVRA